MSFREISADDRVKVPIGAYLAQPEVYVACECCVARHQHRLVSDGQARTVQGDAEQRVMRSLEASFN